MMLNVLDFHHEVRKSYVELSGDSERTVIPLKLDNCEDDDIPLLLRDKKRVTYSDKDEFINFARFLKRQETVEC
jgi:hypothetical protein